MELNLERPIIFFDIESTGLNIAVDAIIELSFVKIFPGGEERIKTWKIKPWDYQNNRQLPISPSASEVNGVKDEDLKDCPKFGEVVDEVLEWLKDSDLAGYNSAKFDLPMLAEEIERVRTYLHKDIDINLHTATMVDVQTIYHLMEPRNLRAAYKFYCGGEEFENAHTAEADTIATYKVLKGQLDMYQDKLKNDIQSLASIGGRPRTVDFAGRLIKVKKNNAESDDNEENYEAVISFGKHKGKTAREVYKTEPSYFAWISQGDFPLDTKRQFELLKQKFDEERKAEIHKPLSGKEFDDATQDLMKHFGCNR